MIVEVTPASVEVHPDVDVVLVATVTNTGSVITAYELTVLGVDPTWVDIDDERPSLFPDDIAVVTITVSMPPGIPSGVRQIAIQVSDVSAGVVEVLPVELVVPAVGSTRIELDPGSITGGTQAEFGVLLTNEGNGPAELILSGTDEESALSFEFDPPSVVIQPGERVVTSVGVRGRRPIAGSSKVRRFEVAATARDGVPVATVGVLVQRPRISRGALALLGLLTAISVFAAVIATTFGRVVDQSTADRDLLLEAIREAGDEGSTGPAGEVTGTALELTTGDPVDGVTVDAYGVDDLTTTVATTVTGADGTYTFEDLPEGDYKVRFRGAGFIEIWFPAGIAPDNAEPVAVAAGETTSDIDVRLGGVPASLSGTIRGEDPAGATVSVRLPGATLASAQPLSAAQTPQTEPSSAAPDPLTDPVVSSVVVDATGEFTLAGIPSPATYAVVVTKEGFATEVQIINVAAGEERSGLDIELRKGDGTIEGHVFSSAGPLGGATVTASDGRTSITTATLTRDDIGAFALRALPTPGTFTLVVEKEGFITETLSVSLGLAESRQGITVTLGDGAGSISGRTTIAGLGPTGGVRVRATDGEITIETASVSVGDVGTYRLTGLPVPGTYTVTYDRDDLAPQTRSIAVDAFGARDVTGADVALIPSTGTVFGTVVEPVPGEPNAAPVPAGNVLVTFTANDRTFRTRTASVDGQVGQFELRSLPPGTYAATFEREGTAPTGLLVVVSAGQRVQVDATLEARSSISGTVCVAFEPDGACGVGEEPLPGVRVVLYLADSFPDQPLSTQFTDAQGFYRFEDLDAPAAYVVTFEAPPLSEPPDPDQSRNVVVQPGQDSGGVDAEFQF